MRDTEASNNLGGASQRSWSNPDSAAIEQLLNSSQRIAVVGLSSDPSRASNGVAAYLISQGFEIIPINPNEKEALGKQSYSDLGSVPGKIDIVDVFRRSEFAVDIARQAISIGVKAIWFQEGVVSEEAFRLAKDSGLTVVMDRCILKEHVRIV